MSATNEISEKVFEDKVKAWLKEKGYWHVKYCAHTVSPKIGCPDILACIDGAFYGIEVKKMGGKPSPAQMKQLRLLRQSGAMAFIVFPSGFEMFKEIVETHKKVSLSPVDYPEILS